MLHLRKQVIKDRKWKELTVAFNFPSTASGAAYILRKYYIGLLHHYEQVYYFRAQGPLVPPPSRWQYLKRYQHIVDGHLDSAFSNSGFCKKVSGQSIKLSMTIVVVWLPVSLPGPTAMSIVRDPTSYSVSETVPGVRNIRKRNILPIQVLPGLLTILWFAVYLHQNFLTFLFAQVTVGFPLNLGQVEIDVQVKGFVSSLILCMCSSERAYIVNFETYSLMVSLKRALWNVSMPVLQKIPGWWKHLHVIDWLVSLVQW